VGLDNVNLTAVSTGSTDGPMPLWALGALGAGMVADGHFKFLHLWPPQNPPLDSIVMA
jgi:hypothetical protein